MIAQVSPIALEHIGWRYYIVFCVCSFTNALVFWLFYPETRSRTLEEMDAYLDNGHILVPLNRSMKPLDSATAREDQLRRGITAVEGADDVSTGGHDDYASDDEKVVSTV